MKKLGKLLSAMLVTVIVAAALVATVGAAEQEKLYDGLITNPTEPTFTFNKYLLMEEDTNVPNVDFVFALESVAADDTLGTSAGIVDGVRFGTTAISATNPVKASFTTASTTYTTVQGADNVVLPAGYKYAKTAVTLDFSKVEFKEPGIYAYKITEDLTGTGSSAVNGVDRYLYVYVTDATSSTGYKLDLSGYLFTTASDSLDETSKTNGIANKYPACTLTFGKEVTGNQGSRDKYFKLTVTLSGDVIRDNDVYEVDTSKAVVSTTKNAATIYEKADMDAANNITTITGAQLKAGYDFYLQDGNYITIIGIPENFQYEITEDAEDYTLAETITAANSSLNWDKTDGFDALTDPVKSDAPVSADIHTGFTNDKTGTIPTGVLMTVGPVVAAGLVVVCGIAAMVVVSAKRKAAEAAESDSEE